MNVPKCSLCKNFYNMQSNKPVMLPDCSHTFCAECVDKQMRTNSDKRFVCPLDEVVS